MNTSEVNICYINLQWYQKSPKNIELNQPLHPLDTNICICRSHFILRSNSRYYQTINYDSS